jgi:hypothetical protein
MRVRTTLAVGVSAATGLALVMTPVAASAGGPAPAAAPIVTVHRLVSDQPGAAQMTDPDLVNAWGMSHPPGGPLWVSDNGSNVSTLYTGAISGSPVTKVPLTVGIPGGAPTGQVYNGTNGFEVPGTGMPALFIFAGENGDLTAWNGTTQAAQVVHQTNAVFKGIALMRTPSGPRLLVANFHGGRVEEFGSGFHLMRSMGFTDNHLPDRYAPFNVAVLRHRVYVTYAKQDAAAHDDVAGPGHGFIDVYTEQGKLGTSVTVSFMPTTRRPVSHWARWRRPTAIRSASTVCGGCYRAIPLRVAPVPSGSAPDQPTSRTACSGCYAPGEVCSLLGVVAR